MTTEPRTTHGRTGGSTSWALLALLCVALPLAASASASLSVPESALGSGARSDGVFRVEARLLVHPDDDLDGNSVRVGMLFDVAPGWHLYWRNPGDTGLPTEVAFTAEGAAQGPIRWPAPVVFDEDDGFLTTYGYTEQVLLASELRFASGAARERTVRAVADVVVCETQCIPARFELSRTLTGFDPAHEQARSLFAAYAESVPRPAARAGVALEAAYSQSAVRPGDAFEGAIAVRPLEEGAAPPDSALFFPDFAEGLVLRGAGGRVLDGALWVALEGAADQAASPGDGRLRGVLTLAGPGDLRRHVEVDLPFPKAARGTEIEALATPWLAKDRPPEAGPGRETVALPAALILAFLGGLLLNLMPCVLPVLAIKAFSLVELAQRDRREVLVHGAAYGTGVLATMLALAAVVATLRGAGASVGWGFQFQEPAFLWFVSAVLVIFALNLFGVFEVHFQGGALAQLGDGAAGPRRSFFEGLVVVVLATPCSAPFLGTAVGFAFASEAAVIFAVFASIGLGLAFPYLLITWVPAAIRLLPRSGAWMLKLRVVLGFALLATVVWLVWVAGRSLGAEGVASLLGFLLLLAFATWVYGALQAAGRARLQLAAGVTLVALAIAGAGVARVELQGGPDADGGLAAKAFDPSAVAARVSEGTPAFVYFTADWCLTCKFNERAVLSDGRVRDALERQGFAVFEADWTRRDENIRAELARFGRAGVPLYLVYTPGAPDRPELLPELLTVERVLGALRRAAEETAGA